MSYEEEDTYYAADSSEFVFPCQHVSTQRELDPIKGHQARCRLYLLFSHARAAARQVTLVGLF
jgi:hypothetical protein